MKGEGSVQHARWARTSSWSGSSAPPGRQTAGRRQRTPATVRPAALRRVPSWPQLLTASAPPGASAARQARRGGRRVRAPGSRPSPPAGSVTMRCLRPALSMTRRWPRTGSACRPAIRFRNAGSPRCSDAHPAAGREPESPMHDRHRRSQTRHHPHNRPAGNQHDAVADGGSLHGCAEVQVALVTSFPVSLRFRLAEFAAVD